jgi:hypothetical protein
MRMKLLYLLLPVLAGCKIFESKPDPQTELDEHRAVWDAAGVADYRMRFQRLCLFCDVQFLTPVRITVLADTIDQINDLETGDPIEETVEGAFLTIDEIFDVIQDAIDENAVEIDVRYEDHLGYPTDVQIDLSRALINDDAQFEVREFEELN